MRIKNALNAIAGVLAAVVLLAAPVAHAQLTFVPASHDFGNRDIAAGPSPASSFILENTGAVDIVLSDVAISGADAPNFNVDDSACRSAGLLVTLAAAETCVVDVTFGPTSVGAKSASLDVQSDGGNPSSSLAGTGITSVAGSLSPAAPLAFGDVALGDTSMLPVTLTSTGSGDISVSLVAFTGPNAADYSETNDCALVLAGNTCTIQVTFAPGAIGARDASMVVTSNADTPIPAYSITGAGIANVPGKPTGVTAIAGQGQAEVSFTPPAFDGGDGITNYTVTSNPGALTQDGGASPITILGLTNGQAYTFTVTATNSAGTGLPSDPSNSVTPLATAPADLRVLARAGNGQALVDVDVFDDGGSAITGYDVTVSPGGATFSGATLPITVTGLSNGTMYTFTATATNAVGTSAVSAPSHTIRPFVPGAPISPLAYVPNLIDNDVYVIDTANRAVITRVLVGVAPLAAAVSQTGTRAYVTNADDGTVSVIDTTTQLVIATVPVGTNPTGIAVSPDGTRVYVANSDSDTVSVIETAGNTVIDSVGMATQPRGIVVSPDGTRVYVTVGVRVRAIDTATNTVVTSGPIIGTPAGIDIVPAGTLLYTANITNLRVNQVNTSNLQSLANTGSTAGEGHGIAIAPNGTIYASRVSTNEIAVINGTTVTTTIPAGDGPRGIAVSPNGAHLYVANENSDTVMVFSTADNSLVSTIPVGFVPGGLGRFIGPALAPQPPTGVTAVVGIGQATVSFTPGYDGGMPITSYTVTSSPPGFTISGAGSPLTVTGLPNGTTYTFTVTATNAVGTSVASAPSNSVTTPAAPGAPTGLVATPSDGAAMITYVAPASDGGSPITQYTATCTPGPFFGTSVGLSLTVSGLTNNVPYSCTVAASNAVGGGPASAPVNVTPNPSTRLVTVAVTGAGTGTVTSTPGGITCPGTCTAPFANASGVTLSAAPTGGSTFRGWSGDCTGTGSCVLTMDAAKSVSALFDPASTGSSAELAIAQAASPGTGSSGKDVVILITVTNNGPAASGVVTVSNPVPAGASYVWASPGCTLGAGTVTCSIGGLASGANTAMRVVLRPAAAGTVTNVASVTGSQSDPNSLNNSSSLPITVVASPVATAVQRYRLYSDVTKEHHFTTDLNEYNTLGTYVGTWVQEGPVGKVLNNPGSFGGVQAVPYYRLYDTTTQWHHWTTDANEFYTLGFVYGGWNMEGVDGYILPTQAVGTIQLYRLNYPALGALHHWTIDFNEYSTLTTPDYGWVGEGGSGFVIQ